MKELDKLIADILSIKIIDSNNACLCSECLPDGLPPKGSLIDYTACWSTNSIQSLELIKKMESLGWTFVQWSPNELPVRNYWARFRKMEISPTKDNPYGFPSISCVAFDKEISMAIAKAFVKCFQKKEEEVLGTKFHSYILL